MGTQKIEISYEEDKCKIQYNNQTISIKFLDTAKWICKKYKQCPNQYVGTINMIQQYAKNLADEHRKDINDRKHNKKKIILILESPSNDEYKDKKNPKPANGKTGTSIKKNIKDLVQCCIELIPKTKQKKYENFEEIELYLVNPVPYPCDLWTEYENIENKIGLSLSDKQERKITDKIFITFWEKCGYKEKFEDILEKIYEPELGDIVINCCTQDLKFLVQDTINNKITDKDAKFISTHPSSWNLNQNNRYVYKYGSVKYFKQKMPK